MKLGFMRCYYNSGRGHMELVRLPHCQRVLSLEPLFRLVDWMRGKNQEVPPEIREEDLDLLF